MENIVKRGTRYRYVRRVPADLLEQFPSPIISRSLRTSDRKKARLLATSYDYQTERIFVTLRTGMLDRTTEKLIVALFLKQRLDELDSIATGKPVSKEAAKAIAIDEKVIENREARQGETFSDDSKRAMLAEVAARSAELDRQALAKHDTWMYDELTGKVANSYRQQHGIKITPDQQKSIALQLINNDRKVNEAAAALHRGEWGLYEALKDKVEAELSKPFCMFAYVLDKYREWYRDSKTNIKPGSMADMEVECRVLMEIIGNISIDAVNSMETVTKLKGILRKYPRNKQQRYGDLSIHSIIRRERGYAVISAKTANEYLRRLKAVIDFALKYKMLTSANVVENEFFKTAVAAEEERLPYD